MPSDQGGAPRPSLAPGAEGFSDEGHGYDVFGLHPPTAAAMARWARLPFERYFRVTAHRPEHLPRSGPAILVANHSGVVPVDGAMLWLDVVRRTGRVLRPIADRFVPQLPFISTTFSRCGVVSGTRTNVRRLLDRGELIAIFPEGITGVVKPYRARYQLQAWRVGHAELAIRHGAPIIPVAIIGAEESWPLLARLPLRAFGIPYLPVPASPLPLPVRFHLHYGEPIYLHRAHAPEAADDAEVVAQAAAAVRDAVEALLARGLAERGRRGNQRGVQRGTQR
jgi:1-acyl-sn-glycerol-3-phosphate acyltransferase